MKRIWSVRSIALGVLLLLAAALALGATIWAANGDLELLSAVVGGGGGRVENGGYQLDATIGQPAAGLAVDGRYALCVGHWCGGQTYENRPPQAAAGGPYYGDEGSPIALDGSGSSDVDAGDVLTYTWDCTADGSDDWTSVHPDDAYCIYPDNGAYTACLRVTDGGGLTGTMTTTVTVDNVAPIVVAGPDVVVAAGEPVTMTASFTDPGTLDTHAIAWNWGDGSTTTGTLAPSHTFAPGIYTVTLTVADDDGGIGQDTAIVTAGGWPIYLPLILRAAP